MDDMPVELREITTYFPEFWRQAGDLFAGTLYEESKLDRKTIELILCALLAARGWETGIKVHSSQALEAGATVDEVRGALLMSSSVAGQSAAVRGLHWAESVLAAYIESAPEK